MSNLTVEDIINYKLIKPLKSNINDRHITELNNVCENYDNKSIKNRLNNIYNFIKYDVDGDWVVRLDIIKNELKNDSSSLRSFKVRYGDEWAIKLFTEKNEKSKIDKNYFIKKFGEVEGPKKFGEFLIKSKTPWGLTACIEKFGEVEGPSKWHDRLNKKINTMLERKKITPYKNGRTLEEYKTRYGDSEGFERWEKRNKTQSYRFSKNFYVNKYGKIDGEEKWLEYCKNNNKTSFEAFTKRYGKDEGTLKYNEHLTKIRNSEHNRYYSKISQKLFWSIYEKMDKTSIVKFAELNGEHFFRPNEEWRKVFSVDFKFGKKVIEFDGDYWHSKEDAIVLDRLKDEFLINNGYEIIRVSDSEYRKNPTLIEQKCLNFIKDKK